MNVLESKSKVTDRYQTTVPAPIRKVLKLGKKDALGWLVTESGEVHLVNASPRAMAEEDPSLAPFLELLSKDMQEKPGRIAVYDTKQARVDADFRARRKAKRG